jgi:hypothetical protein
MEVMNMKPRYKYMAIDQYGDKVLIEKHPRKELLEHTGYSSASKMYIDDKDGNTFHTGYVVGPQRNNPSARVLFAGWWLLPGRVIMDGSTPSPAATSPRMRLTN